eukprot:COSAG06_NODE_191_length_20709_cov_8.536778_9_plen_374_part_00
MLSAARALLKGTAPADASLTLRDDAAKQERGTHDDFEYAEEELLVLSHDTATATGVPKAKREAGAVSAAAPRALATRLAHPEKGLAEEAARLSRAAGQHGDSTGITHEGIKHAMTELRRANPASFVIDGEFFVHNPAKLGGFTYCQEPLTSQEDWIDAHLGAVLRLHGEVLLHNGTRVTAISETAGYGGRWIEVAGGRWLPKKYLKPVLRRMTTSDLIKAHIQPATVPPGWTVEPEVTNVENSWYTHHYLNLETGERHTQKPPPNTFSFCARMAADPATAHFIGKPTHFLSHAHTMNADETLESVDQYVSKLPAEEAAKIFWWIDGFVSFLSSLLSSACSTCSFSCHACFSCMRRRLTSTSASTRRRASTTTR